jgi:Fe-S-cluster containining protein
MTSDANRLPAITASDIFECRQCGECCHGYGGTVVTEKDIHAIADFIGTSVDDFLGEYVSRSGLGLVLAQGEDGYCIFADQGRCGIHAVKPGMCKAWPFIEGVLRDPGNWFIMAGFCPGIRVDVSESTIRRCVEAVMEVSGEKGRKK